MKSIRISDEAYAMARQEAGVMSCSIAQQLEHWAQLEAALELSGVTQEQVWRIFGGDLRTRERVFMKLGLASQDSMVLVPRAAARSAHVPSGSMSSSARRRRWP